MNEKDIDYAIRCFKKGKRIKTNALKKSDAVVFKITAEHLIKYLTETYKI